MVYPYGVSLFLQMSSAVIGVASAVYFNWPPSLISTRSWPRLVRLGISFFRSAGAALFAYFGRRYSEFPKDPAHKLMLLACLFFGNFVSSSIISIKHDLLLKSSKLLYSRNTQ